MLLLSSYTVFAQEYVKVFDDKNLVLKYNYPDGYRTTYEIINAIVNNGGEQLDTGTYKMKNIIVKLSSYKDTFPNVNLETFPAERLINKIKAIKNSGFYGYRKIIGGNKIDKSVCD